MAEHWIEADNPHVRSDQEQDARWWAAFGDPTLDQLVQAASQQNISLRVAAWRITQAREERGVAVGNLLPQQQQMAGQYTRNAISTTAFPYNFFSSLLPTRFFENWSAGFSAAWELDFWGRFRRAVEAADANLDAQVAGYDQVLVLLQAEAATNYIQMRDIEERLVLARKNVDLQKETLRIINARYRRGAVTELDVQQAATNLGTTETLIPVLETARSRAQNRLAILLGMLPQQLQGALPASGAVPQAPPEIVVGIPADLLRRRPDVRRAEREAAAQSARIGIAESEFYPHIAITGNIGVQAERLNHLFDSQSLTGMIGPGFQWNILNYGRILHNARAEDARFQQAMLNYQDTVLRANEEVENAVVAFLREQERRQVLEKNARAAARSVELAMRQYEQGLISYTPLLDTERALVEQQDALAESRGLVSADLVAVYRALAGGWEARLPSNQSQSEAIPAPATQTDATP